MRMPNIASVLKAEISRLARKELRDENEGLKRAVILHRREIATLKARLLALEKIVQRLGKASRTPGTEARVGNSKAGVELDAPGDLRFRAAGMASNRKRLGLSAADFALLVGTTGQSIYAWEAGKSKPRPDALKAIASLRHIGKREVEARLAKLKG
jgi:DNA-binding XRE family transcriptional regulator